MAFSVVVVSFFFFNLSEISQPYEVGMCVNVSHQLPQ